MTAFRSVFKSIVQMKRLIPFKQEYFQATAALFRRYRQLAARHPEGSF